MAAASRASISAGSGLMHSVSGISGTKSRALRTVPRKSIRQQLVNIPQSQGNTGFAGSYCAKWKSPDAQSAELQCALRSRLAPLNHCMRDAVQSFATARIATEDGAKLAFAMIIESAKA